MMSHSYTDHYPSGPDINQRLSDHEKRIKELESKLVAASQRESATREDAGAATGVAKLSPTAAPSVSAAYWHHSARAWTPALSAIIRELERAESKFGPVRNTHEGYAVLLEEVDELWDEIKANDKEHAKKEAVQVAATALRFLLDLYEWEPEELESKLGAAEVAATANAERSQKGHTPKPTAAPSVSAAYWHHSARAWEHTLSTWDTSRNIPSSHSIDAATNLVRAYHLAAAVTAWANSPSSGSTEKDDEQLRNIALAFVRGEPLPQKGG